MFEVAPYMVEHYMCTYGVHYVCTMFLVRIC